VIQLDNQVAIITGRRRGLGSAYAQLLAKRGARIVVHDAGVSKDGTGSDPSVAASVMRDIRESGGIEVPSAIAPLVGCSYAEKESAVRQVTHKLE